MAQKGDFIGFTFNGVHSSELGIVRTSDGSRFNSNLLPTIQEKTVQVPGGDGTYFFGSYYTQRQFSVSYATDEVTEEQYRRIVTLFSDKQIHDLIFDETPYKVYSAKCTGTPQFKFICFDDNGERIYKGEGIIQFTCYYPFARSRFKYLDQYTISTVPEWANWMEGSENNFDLIINSKEELYYPGQLTSAADGNKSEWAGASKMQDEQGSYDITGNTSIKVYNAGDLPCDFKIYFSSPITTLSMDMENLKLTTFELKDGDSYYCINSKTNLIEGCDNSFNPTGTLYNEFIIAGDFFKIPMCNLITDFFEITTDGVNIEKIEYDYLYI